MRILIISDIHANLTALDAVLKDAGEIDGVWCLGDLVGYGPDPNECIARVRQMPGLKCILGNHDAAALRQIDPATFNPDARHAISWTQSTLTESSVDFLLSLPERIDLEKVTLAHGSARQPVWEYLLDTTNATRSFDYFTTPYCFVGHTHLPILYHLGENQRLARLLIPEPGMRLNLTPRAILNPGSVGQPRDRDARSSYAIFDSGRPSWEFRRVAYNIAEVQGRMTAAGLPERHIQRLSAGW